MSIDNSKGNSSRSFLKGAAVLSISMIVVKLIGFLYKILITNVYSTLGGEYASIGAGLLSNAYEIYNVLFTVASAGLPVAVSRLISESTTQGRYKDTRRIHELSKPLFAFMGIVCFLIMVGSSFWYVNLIQSPYAIYPVLTLSPIIITGCLVSIYRGYYQGTRNMVPTAVSEVIEAVTKLVLGIVFAYIVINTGLSQYKTTGTIFGLTFKSESDALNTLISFSVSGAICGIVLGSLFAFLYLWLRFKIKGDGIPKEYYESSLDAISKRETLSKLIKTAVPIGLAALLMSVTGLIDMAIIQNVLFNTAINHREALLAQFNGMLDDTIPPDAILPGGDTSKITIQTALWGCYSCSLTFMQLVTALTQAFATSAMPNVTAAYTKGNKKELAFSIETVLKLTTMVTFPAGLGLSVLAQPIISVVYYDKVITTFGAKVLSVIGISVIFIACSTPICSMLQGVGRTDLPLKLFAVGMGIKILVNYLFVSVIEINIVGAAVGSLVAYILICIAGIYLLIKNSGVIPDLLSTVLKPFLAAVICAASAYLAYSLTSNVLPSIASLIVSIATAVLFYIISLLLLRTFTANELKFLPKGEKIVKLLEKCRLMR